MWEGGVGWCESGVLTVAVAVVRNALFDMSGFADAAAVFGHATFNFLDL